MLVKNLSNMLENSLMIVVVIKLQTHGGRYQLCGRDNPDGDPSHLLPARNASPGFT